MSGRNGTDDGLFGGIQVQGLSKSFGRQGVLRKLDLTVARGEYLTLFGPNGSGKTTLIKILATLMRPDEGEVHIEGASLRRSPNRVRSLVGVVTHQTMLYNDLTVAENLEFYGRMYQIPHSEARIQQLLQQLRLELYATRKVRTLSNGMQKRLTIARSLLHDPPVLLLDEPETGLDQEALASLEEVFRTDSQGRRRTILMATHSLEMGVDMGDRVAILAGGRVVFQEDRRIMDLAAFRGAYQRYTGAAG